MRSLPGEVRAASTKLVAGGRAASASPSARPDTTSSQSALSITERVTEPNTLSPYQCSRSGISDTRPRCGFSPKRPQQAAGMRIEPPPSLAIPAAARPAATAAPLPPLEPPVVYPVSQGLRVAPQVADSVHG